MCLFTLGRRDFINASFDSIIVLISFLTSLFNPILYVKYLGVTRSAFRKFWTACTPDQDQGKCEIPCTVPFLVFSKFFHFQKIKKQHENDKIQEEDDLEDVL